MVFGVDVLDLDFVIQINSIDVDQCLIVLKHIQQSFLMRRLDV